MGEGRPLYRASTSVDARAHIGDLTAGRVARHHTGLIHTGLGQGQRTGVSALHGFGVVPRG